MALNLMTSYATLYWQCQSAEQLSSVWLSVTPTTVMMAATRSCVVCVVLCLINTVQSVKIRGTIESNLGITRNVEEVEYINGDKWDHPMYVDLNQLVDAKTLPKLTLVNLKNLNGLSVMNIPLETVPVFENISTYHIEITGSKIKYVLTNAFNGAQVRVIRLQKNEINTMCGRSINADCRELYLRCNQLSNFSAAWFKDPSSIFRLDLSGNRIDALQQHAFKQMTQLSVLELSYNRITRIDNEAFNARITDLQLQFNKIDQLTPDMFVQLDKPVASLFLHHNELNFLPEEVLLKLKPAQITLDGNPWQCRCLRDIERMIREQNITRRYLRDRRNEPVCLVPLILQDACVLAVDKELQQTYAKGLSPLTKCLATPCTPCLALD